jgi:hypothetical protein
MRQATGGRAVLRGHRAWVLGCGLLVALLILFRAPSDNTLSALAQPPSSSLTVVSRSSKALPFPARAFWHIAESGSPAWRPIYLDQYSHIKRCGLLDSMHVTATFVSNHTSLMPTFDDPRVTVEYGGPSTQYEYPSLVRLQEYCAKVSGMLVCACIVLEDPLPAMKQVTSLQTAASSPTMHIHPFTRPSLDA